MDNAQSHRSTRLFATIDVGALRQLLLLICLWLIPQYGAAQSEPRDYAISPPRVNYSAEGNIAVVSFTVSNQGGDASEPSQIIISEYQSGRVESIEPLPAIAADQAREFAIQLPLTELSTNGIVSFKIEAGIDAFELANSPIARDNSQLFHIDRAATGDADGGDGMSEATAEADATFDLSIPIVNLGINFLEDGIQLNDRRYSGGDILGAIGILALALFCLWLLSLILRLLFRRPPRFDVWQPPYAQPNWQDPNSEMARRQSWQFHAQNSALAAPNAPDQVTVVKRLLDKRGLILGSWRIKAMRTVQYDIYGRINRTEALMPRKIISRLNRVIGRAPGYDNNEMHKALSPIAKSLSRQALGPVEKQNLMLPFALDIRFEGITDDIRIQFELYQYGDSAWHLINQWAPEFGQVGERVPEHFTFTINGQLSGESKKEYKNRLREDITQLLAGLFYERQGEAAVAPGKPEGETDWLNPEEEPMDRSPLDDETNPHSIPEG